MFFFKKKKLEKEKVRKHHKSGIELEYFLIDRKGKIANSAPEIISKTKEKYPDLPIVPEVGQNMIEIASAPEIMIPDIMDRMLSDLNKIISVAESMGLFIYPFGTYPGKYTPILTENKRYKILEKIFGKKRFSIAMQCVGVHTHFTLPWGVFDSKNKTVKSIPFESKYKEAMINTFNFYIAADPALTTFAQSSPFFQGQHIAKDSRMVMYRSGALKNPDSWYANFPEYGSLHSYILTNTDMVHAIENRFNNWVEILNKTKTDTKDFLKNNSILGTTWSPVRINSHGTTESRSMDANLPSIIFALAMIMKFVSKNLQEDFIKVKISDAAIDTPFLLENGVLLIPPDSYVINKLQVESAYEGLESQKVYNYCRAFLNLGEKLVPADRQHFLEPLRKIISNRKTVSDIIIEKAQKLGWEKDKELDSDMAGKIAVSSYNDLLEDLMFCKRATIEYFNLAKKGDKK